MAAMLASCSTDSFDTAKQVVEPQDPAIAGKTPIGFDTYFNRPLSTRAGATGTLTDALLKDADEDAGKAGFGVFAYYTDNLDYVGQSKPNFMYNQQVKTEDGGETWIYEPVKYWPNEYGDAAISSDIDKVSFFAYAPYVNCDPVTGKLVDDSDTDEVDESTLDNYGITGFTKNNFAGDPMIKYIASLDMAKTVDLCYGVVATGYDQWQILGGGIQNLQEGYPYLDVEHPAKIKQPMKFNFKHALAQLNVRIDVDADVEGSTHDNSDNSSAAAGTKVYVRSVSFKGFALKGALNLNNTEFDKARWMNYNGQGELTYEKAETYIINDGRKNGKEGITAAPNEKNIGLNQDIISNDGNTTRGVEGTQKNLFALDLDLSTAADPENPTAEEMTAAIAAANTAQLGDGIFVIPVDPDEPMTVTIVYDVETTDSKLATTLSDGSKGSRVRNEITKEVTFNGGGLKSGYKHILNLHLGLNSVKFEAEVAGWGNNSTSANGWLPITEAPGLGTYNPGNSLNITYLNSEAHTDLTASNAVTASIMGINGGANTMTVQSDSGDASTEWMIENTQVAAIQAVAPGRAATRNEVPEGFAATATGKSIKIAPVAAGTTTLHSTYKGKESTIVITVIAPSLKLSASSVNLYTFTAGSKTGSVEASWDAPAIYEGSMPTINSVESDNEAIATVSEESGIITITPVGAGTAHLTVTDSDGNIKTVTVKVTSAALAANKTAITLIKGKEDATFKLSTVTPSATFEAPEDEGGYQLQYTLSENAPFTFEDGVIKASSELDSDAEGTMTIQYVGHTEETDPKVVVTVSVLATDITAMAADQQAANPLWKVAQYNVASNGTSFVKSHSTASQYVFSWADAKNIEIEGYHLPTALEQVAIIPSHNSAGNGTNIFAQNTATFVYPAASASGDFAVASGIGGQFVQNGAKNDLYACRKLGDKLTAWHYKWVTSPCNGLLIESYVLESTDGSAENMAKIASALAASDVWSEAEANEKPESSSETSSLVSRFLPACGDTDSSVGSGVATANVGTNGYYWSNTANGESNAFYWSFISGNLHEHQSAQGYGFSVRLFHN